MRKLFSSTTAFVAGLVLVAVVGALLILPSNDYIFLPDPAHPVAPLVHVPGGHDPKVGGIYYVDILLRKAKLYEQLLRRVPRGRRPLSRERGPPSGRRRGGAAADRYRGHAELAAGRRRGRVARGRQAGDHDADRREDRRGVPGTRLPSASSSQTTSSPRSTAGRSSRAPTCSTRWRSIDRATPSRSRSGAPARRAGREHPHRPRTEDEPRDRRHRARRRGRHPPTDRT